MSGRLRAVALIIGIEQYRSEAELGRVDGAVQAATAFRDWLIDVRGADLKDVFICTEPMVGGGCGAAREDIRNAAIDLIDRARDADTDLFVFYSGHGGRVDYEELLIPADYRADDGDKCIRLSQLQAQLWQALGPGTHYWFVNCCRTQVALTVPHFILPGKPSPRGHSRNENRLFASVNGTFAPTRSPFHGALEAALYGTRRAKRWFRDAYWVTFPGLVDVVRYACQDEGMEIAPEPAPELGKIVELPPPVPETSILINVRGARNDASYKVALGGGERPPIILNFTGPRAQFSIPPGDYLPALELEDGRVHVEHYEPVDMFQNAVLEFDLSTVPVETPVAPPMITIGPPDTSELWYLVSQAGDDHVLVASSTSASFKLAAGPLEIRLFDRDEPIRNVVIGLHNSENLVRSGTASTTVQPHLLRPHTPLMDNLLATMSCRDALRLADFLPGSTADALIADPDTSSLLAVLGAAAICGLTPYPPLVQRMHTFELLSDQQSAIYVVTPLGLHSATIASEPEMIELASIPELGTNVRHSWRYVEPGRHSVRVTVDDRDVETSTMTFPGHVTLVVLGADHDVNTAASPLRPLQFALPPGHMAEMTTTARQSVLSAVRFGALVQRRFAEKRAVMADNAHPEHQALWQDLLTGKWPDPMTMLVAAYELVRRGALAGDLRTLLQLLDVLVSRFRHSRFVDVDVLRALVAGETLAANDEIPLVLDGAVAIGASFGTDPPGMALEYSGLWTRWRTWGLAPTPRPRLLQEPTPIDVLRPGIARKRPPGITFTDTLDSRLVAAAGRSHSREATTSYTEGELAVQVQVTSRGDLKIFVDLQTSTAELLLQDHGGLFLPLTVTAEAEARYWIILRPIRDGLSGRIEIAAPPGRFQVSTDGPLVGISDLATVSSEELLPSLHAMFHNPNGIRTWRALAETLPPAHPLRVALERYELGRR